MSFGAAIDRWRCLAVAFVETEGPCNPDATQIPRHRATEVILLTHAVLTADISTPRISEAILAAISTQQRDA